MFGEKLSHLEENFWLRGHMHERGLMVTRVLGRETPKLGV